MEWMLSSIVVVENNLNDIVFLQDVSIGIFAINGRICRFGSRSQNAVERWYYWCSVCNVVEKGAALASDDIDVRRCMYLLVGAVSKIVHLQIKSDSLVWVLQ